MRGEVESLKEIMDKSANMGMQTFDTALFKLYQEGKISLEEALKNADSENNLRLKVKLHSRTEEVSSPSEEKKGAGSMTTSSGLTLSLEEKEEDKPDENDPFAPL